MKKVTKYLFCVLLGLITTMSFGQKEANHWYFGNNIGLDFTNANAVTPPTVTNGITGVPGSGDIMESATSISDAAGNFLFATSGQNIYSSDLVQRGTISNGSTWGTAQGAMIIPKPGTPYSYYLVSISDNGCTGNPSVYKEISATPTVGNNINLTIPPINLQPTGITHGQMVLPKTNALGVVLDDFWLVQHEYGTNGLIVYSVTAAGITYSHTVNAGPVATAASCNGATAYFKANACFNQFGYSFDSQVHLFGFDTETGAINFNNSSGTISASYGVEFSKNGEWMYVATGTDNSGPFEVWKVPVTPGATTTSTLGAPVKMGNMPSANRGGCLQMGPDGRIYVASMNSWGNAFASDWLGAIENPDLGTATYTAQFVEINNTGSNLAMGLPTFITSLVSSLATLVIDGDIDKTEVCKGESATFKVQIDGGDQVATDWKAVGANNDTQAGGLEFTVLMANAGTTTITVEVTDACGRKRILDFDVETLDIENATGTVATCPSRVVTGSGSSSGNYAWYSADPGSGGSLLGYGSTYDAGALSSVWVQPAGTISSSTENDTRSSNSWGNATGNTTITLSSGTAVINNFSVRMYTWGTFSGNLEVELRDGTNTIVGTAMSQVMTATPTTQNIVFNPTDWNLAAGTYTVVVTSVPGGANFGSLTSPSYSGGNININGGQTVTYNITTSEETSTASCITGSLVPIASCCTQLAPTIAVTTGTAIICTGNPLILTATKAGATAGPVVFQWYKGGVAISGATSATYTIPTTVAAASANYTATVTTSGSCTGESPASSPIAITVNATPGAPTGTGAAYCEGETAAQLSATGTGLLWYTVATGGTGVATAPTPTTTSAGTTSYYVSQTVTSCEGPRLKIDIVVTGLPGAPTGTGTTYCQGETAAQLTAIGTGLLWYTVATGGTGVATAPTPTTTSAGTTSYYVSQTITSCEGPRLKIDIVVTGLPGAPTGTGATYCEGETAVQLSATGTGLLWYTVATGGTGVATAPTPTTASAGTTSYYVSVLS